VDPLHRGPVVLISQMERQSDMAPSMIYRFFDRD
jgi:hypothetical protein